MYLHISTVHTNLLKISPKDPTMTIRAPLKGCGVPSTAYQLKQGVHESCLPVAHPGYQVLSDILFRLGLIANALTQYSS